jgi:hypothetical protein
MGAVVFRELHHGNNRMGLMDLALNLAIGFFAAETTGFGVRGFWEA